MIEIPFSLNEPVDPERDYRRRMFEGSPWFERLPAPESGITAVSLLAKGEENRWEIQLLNVALAFAIDHGLEETYRTKFAGISLNALMPARAIHEGRGVSTPLWEIANELVVGCLVERGLGWKYQEYEPPGRHGRRGEWQFQSPSKREIFVEVKSLREAEDVGSGAFSRPDYRSRIRSSLTEAYKQLPDDGRASLVVLVGNSILSISHGIMLGDVFAALFGRYQISFPANQPLDTGFFTAGPSFHDTYVQRGKHRSLGCVAGLVVRGLGQPSIGFYAIPNPWAHKNVRFPESDLRDARRFEWMENGGHEVMGIRGVEIWNRMSS
jgi:hypothetical protein